MKRIYVQFSADRSCLLTGDKLEYTDDSNFVKVYNGTELVGIFDLFHTPAIYMTEPAEKK